MHCRSLGRLLVVVFIAQLGTVSPAEEMPPSSVGKFRERTVLAWENDGNVTTRVIKVWDPYTDLKRSFEWLPISNSSEIEYSSGVTGKGRIVWRLPAYNDLASGDFHESFQGWFMSGRRHGHGKLTTAAGSTYEGEFEKGEFHGFGALSLPNGTEYTGEFLYGKPSGVGRLSFASGRHFNGKLAPHQSEALASAIETMFHKGIKVEPPLVKKRHTSEVPIETLRLVQLGSSSVKVHVYTDKAENIKYKNESPYKAYGYHRNSITPDRIIIKRDPFSDDFDEPPKIYEMLPTFLVAEIENIGTKTLQIEEASLYIKESKRNLQPYPLVSTISDQISQCFFDLDEWSFPDSKVNIDNFGHGQIQNAEMFVRFVGNGNESQLIEVDLGNFKDYQTVSVTKLLEKMGVEIGVLKKDDPMCQNEISYEQCVQNVKESGIFGELYPRYLSSREYSGSLDRRFIWTDIEGEIKYVWQDEDRNIVNASLKFSESVPIYSFARSAMAECGAPGPIIYSEDVISLKLDGSDYPVELSIPRKLRSLKAHERHRVGIVLDAEASSDHEFELRIGLSDGTWATSPLVELSIFYLRTNKEYPSENYVSIEQYRRQ